MCEPISLALLGGAAVAGQAVSMGMGQMASNRAARANAEIGLRNAETAGMAADRAIVVGKQEESDYRLQVEGMKGRQRSTIAAAGVDVASGSAVDILESTQQQADSEMARLREAVAFEAWGIRRQRADLIAQSRASRASTSSPWMGVAGSLLTGASNVASQYIENKRYA